MTSLRPVMHAAAFLMLGVVACGHDEAAPTLTQPVTTDRASFTITVPEFAVSATDASEAAFGTVSDGTNALVPFTIDNVVTTKLYSRQGVLLNTLSTGRNGKQPVAAFDGTRFLVAWSDRTDLDEHVWGQFVKANGTAAGAAFKLSTTKHVKKVIGVAFSGGKYLVLYVTETNVVYGRFVMPDKSLGSTITIAQNGGGGRLRQPRR